jgi:hypothetical protein
MWIRFFAADLIGRNLLVRARLQMVAAGTPAIRGLRLVCSARHLEVRYARQAASRKALFQLLYCPNSAITKQPPPSGKFHK